MRKLARSLRNFWDADQFFDGWIIVLALCAFLCAAFIRR